MRASSQTPEPRMRRVLLLHDLFAQRRPANAKPLPLSLLLSTFDDLDYVRFFSVLVICSSGFDIWIEGKNAMEFMRLYSRISERLILGQRSGCTSAPIHITIFSH